MSVVFWMLCGLVFYVYVGYPVLLHVWARFRLAPPNRGGARAGHGEPSVSIVIASRNEGGRIPGRLDNLRQLDYPSHKQQIIVVSDGSTDNTSAVLARIPRVVAVDQPAGGKARALNAGVARATNEESHTPSRGSMRMMGRWHPLTRGGCTELHSHDRSRHGQMLLQ